MKNYVPLVLIEKNLTKAEIQYRNHFEQANIERASNLIQQTKDEELQYYVMKYMHWQQWSKKHFDLLRCYIDSLVNHESILARMVLYPELHKKADYKKEVRDSKKDIRLLMEGLGISQSVLEIADRFEEAVDNVQGE
jgi:hypothetical protein